MIPGFSLSKTTLLALFLTLSLQIANGQEADQLNAIHTAAPFLTIAPDGRSTGMGDVGVATAPDLNSQHWNSAKYAFIEGRWGVAATYTPWTRHLTPGRNLGYLTGYYKINEKNIVSSSLRYFSLPINMFPAVTGLAGITIDPFETAFDAGYSRKFTDNFSGGVVFRYIHSDLTRGHAVNGEETRPGTSFAGDLGLYYQDDIQLGEKPAQWAVGLNISNVGSPISYTADAKAVPIPTNLRLGGRFCFNINASHSISLNTDLNKLLVPTPANYYPDSIDEGGNLVLEHGKAAPESVLAGMFQSFYDAPGYITSDGTRSIFLEEMHEIAYSVGAEYWYKKRLAFRTGYYHEHLTKGNRKYFTFGAGARVSIVTLDISYLLPRGLKSSSLYNTFRFGLTVEIGRGLGV
ncbi:MAG: type IX secretion system outer membrane channel protein PorV [Bacteroidota bacterium]